LFENRVLRRIFGPKREEVTEEWIKLHNEELHNLHSSQNIIRVVKSRTVRWSRHGRDEKCIQNFGQET
jgi:TPP-dependent pyruvate/acetoin dehydrogenase alpha subunit